MTLQENALQLAFKKAVLDGTARDKDVIKRAMFGQKVKIQLAPKVGNIPVEKIQKAVESVSKKK